MEYEFDDKFSSIILRNCSEPTSKMLRILHLFYEILLGSEQLPFYYKMLYITNNNGINIK